VTGERDQTSSHFINNSSQYVPMDTVTTRRENIPDDSFPDDGDQPTQQFPRFRPQVSLPRSRRGLLTLGGVIFALLLVGVLVVPRVLGKKTPHVTLYTVHTQQLSAYVGGGGLTFPNQQLNIVFPITAQVVKVDVQVGQSVKVGQALVTMDSADLDRQLALAYSSWQNAQNYANSVAGTTQYNSAITQAANAKAAYDALNAFVNSPTYRHGNLVAPFAGVVTALGVTSNSIANAGVTLVTLQDISSMIVHAQFPLEQRSAVTLGQTVEVDPAATPDQKFNGTVSNINPVLTSPGSDTFEVWITVPNPNQLLFTSESVYARVLTQQSMPVVPQLAVVNPDADSIVFVYSGGKAHLRHVVVGPRNGDQFGIVNGLQDGDQVILIGQFNLSDNEPVVVSRVEQ
jgi:RND family efflux transporter MFP subunit